MREGFSNFQGGESEFGSILVAALTLVVLIVVQLFIVQFLWNNVLVSTLSVVRPLKTLLQTLGLLVLLAFLFPNVYM